MRNIKRVLCRFSLILLSLFLLAFVFDLAIARTHEIRSPRMAPAAGLNQAQRVYRSRRKAHRHRRSRAYRIHLRTVRGNLGFTETSDEVVVLNPDQIRNMTPQGFAALAGKKIWFRIPKTEWHPMTVAQWEHHVRSQGPPFGPMSWSEISEIENGIPHISSRVHDDGEYVVIEPFRKGSDTHLICVFDPHFDPDWWREWGHPHGGEYGYRMDRMMHGPVLAKDTGPALVIMPYNIPVGCSIVNGHCCGSGGGYYCCASCARMAGQKGVADRAA